MKTWGTRSASTGMDGLFQPYTQVLVDSLSSGCLGQACFCPASLGQSCEWSNQAGSGAARDGRPHEAPIVSAAGKRWTEGVSCGLMVYLWVSRRPLTPVLGSGGQALETQLMLSPGTCGTVRTGAGIWGSDPRGFARVDLGDSQQARGARPPGPGPGVADGL